MSTLVTETFSDKVAKYFDGDGGFKVTNENGTVWYEKDGVRLQLYQKSIGYKGTFDLTVDRPSYGSYGDSIARVTASTNIKHPKFRKRFIEQATRRINDELSRRITAPAIDKSQERSEKIVAKWMKDNAKWIEHKSISGVEPRKDYSGKNQTDVGTDKLITKINSYAKGIPSHTQMFGIIVQSGIKVHNVSNGIEVIGNGEETTAFLTLLDHFLEWKF